MSNPRVYLTEAASNSLPFQRFPGFNYDPDNTNVAYIDARTASVSDDHGWLRIIVQDGESGTVTIRLPPTSVAAVVWTP